MGYFSGYPLFTISHSSIVPGELMFKVVGVIGSIILALTYLFPLLP